MDVSERKATRPTDLLKEGQEFGSWKWLRFSSSSKRSDRDPKPPEIAQESTGSLSFIQWYRGSIPLGKAAEA
jgi:hypothetical protein